MIGPAEAIRILKEGKVVALPTETVYGLAADATNPAAVARIFSIKRRPADNPLICHFHSVEQIEGFVLRIPEPTRILLKHFSPGPLSCMLDVPPDSPLRFATCGSEQVIVRIPSHPVFAEISSALAFPLAAPSANTSGHISPTSAQMVEADLGNLVDAIVEGGPCQVGLESTIVDARTVNVVRLLRPGKISKEEIEEVLPAIPVVEETRLHSVTPGSRYRHYAPRTPLFPLKSLEEIGTVSNCALLLTDEEAGALSELLVTYIRENYIHVFLLGSENRLEDVARHLYERLNQMDSLRLSAAYITKTDWGNTGLGAAITNRLAKMVSAMVTE